MGLEIGFRRVLIGNMTVYSMLGRGGQPVFLFFFGWSSKSLRDWWIPWQS